MIPTIANIRKAIYCLNKRIDQLSGKTEIIRDKVSDLESLISDETNPTDAIDKFNEIVAFLNTIENTDTLSGLLGDIINNIPTKVSDLENDIGYLTEHQDIGNKANIDQQQILVEAIVQLKSEVDALIENKDNLGNVKVESIDTNNIPKVANSDMIITGSGSPTIVPKFIGQRYLDTTNYVAYTAYKVTNSTGDWHQD